MHDGRALCHHGQLVLGTARHLAQREGLGLAVDAPLVQDLGTLALSREEQPADGQHVEELGRVLLRGEAPGVARLDAARVGDCDHLGSWLVVEHTAELDLGHVEGEVGEAELAMELELVLLRVLLVRDQQRRLVRARDSVAQEARLEADLHGRALLRLEGHPPDVEREGGGGLEGERQRERRDVLQRELLHLLADGHLLIVHVQEAQLGQRRLDERVDEVGRHLVRGRGMG